MATQRLGENESFLAGADLRTARYKLMEISATKTVTLADNASDKVVGILQNQPNTGQEASVALVGGPGISKVLCDGSGTAIVYGDPLKTNGVGLAIKAVTAGDWVIGHATEAVSAANIVGGVDTTRGGYHLPA